MAIIIEGTNWKISNWRGKSEKTCAIKSGDSGKNGRQIWSRRSCGRGSCSSNSRKETKKEKLELKKKEEERRRRLRKDE